MGTWTKFEDINAWQKARELAKNIYFITKKEGLRKDFALKDQMRRSSGSIMDNIAEGMNRGGNKEFVHFLSISKGSAGELQSQLYRALDQNYIDQQTFNKLYEEVDETSAMIKGLINYLKKSNYRGFKFSIFFIFVISILY